MSKMILTLAASFLALSAQAKTIKSSDVKLPLANIDQVIRLVDKNDPGSSHRKLNLVVTDTGMSTDVSPRVGIYLALASWAEMGNISAEFELTKTALVFISAQRKAAGVYEIKYLDAIGIKEVTMTVDATRLFADEKKTRAKCGGDFCDEALSSSVTVTETARDYNPGGER